MVYMESPAVACQEKRKIIDLFRKARSFMIIFWHCNDNQPPLSQKVCPPSLIHFFLSFVSFFGFSILFDTLLCICINLQSIPRCNHFEDIHGSVNANGKQQNILIYIIIFMHSCKPIFLYRYHKNVIMIIFSQYLIDF